MLGRVLSSTRHLGDHLSSSAAPCSSDQTPLTWFIFFYQLLLYMFFSGSAASDCRHCWAQSCTYLCINVFVRATTKQKSQSWLFLISIIYVSKFCNIFVTFRWLVIHFVHVTGGNRNGFLTVLTEQRILPVNLILLEGSYKWWIVYLPVATLMPQVCPKWTGLLRRFGRFSLLFILNGFHLWEIQVMEVFQWYWSSFRYYYDTMAAKVLLTPHWISSTDENRWSQ